MVISDWTKKPAVISPLVLPHFYALYTNASEFAHVFYNGKQEKLQFKADSSTDTSMELVCTRSNVQYAAE